MLKKVKDETKAVVVWRTSFLLKEVVFRSYSHSDGSVPLVGVKRMGWWGNGGKGEGERHEGCEGIRCLG